MAFWRMVDGEWRITLLWAVTLFVFVFLILGLGTTALVIWWTGDVRLGAPALGIGLGVSIRVWRFWVLSLLRRRNRPDRERDPDRDETW